MDRVGWIAAYRAELEVLIQVALAMLLGAAIGFEREAKDKPAGLRTHMLMAGAAALLMAVGAILIEQLNAKLGAQVVDSDPLRMVGAVVTGVSFLGAGTILRRGRERQVEGLTTAASLLVSATVGMCVALAKWVLAVGVTLLALLTLRGVGRLVQWLDRRHPSSA
jgi:putative Mg2+ transporter-C (MgtC) family protein